MPNQNFVVLSMVCQVVSKCHRDQTDAGFMLNPIWIHAHSCYEYCAKWPAKAAGAQSGVQSHSAKHIMPSEKVLWGAHLAAGSAVPGQQRHPAVRQSPQEWAVAD